MSKSYQVGDLYKLRDNDPEFTEFDDAVKKAIEMSKNDSAIDTGKTIGIWKDSAESIALELIALVHDEELFEKWKGN